MAGRRLVADVGGTNTRFGLVEAGRLIEASLSSIRNDDVPSFAEAALDYKAMQGDVALSDVVIAIAGPVSEGRGALTNRDWPFDAGALSATLGAQTSLLNDLTALGLAVRTLTDDDVVSIHAKEPRGDQALVLGVGTGCNASPVKLVNGHATAFEVEFGHCAMPQDIHALIADVPHHFVSIEELFSGRGYKAFVKLMPDETTAIGLYARCLARLAKAAANAYRPEHGLYFAGGVARHVLAAGGQAAFCQELQAEAETQVQIVPPIWVIEDDRAALRGCADFTTR